MKRLFKCLVVSTVPVLLLAGSALSSAEVASASTAKTAHVVNANPDGTPTGCPAPGHLCSYFHTGSGQGASDICINTTGNVTFWVDHSVKGNNCHNLDGALVNTHAVGDNELWSGTNGTGQEACINNGSYYTNLSGNFYPNGSELINNINSNFQENGGSC